jgi:hypothetical protein
VTRNLPSSTVAPELAAKYLEKGRKFRRDAEAMHRQLGAFSGSSVAVLSIHAAIAYADALTIRAAGRKSKSGDHRDAESFLASVLALRSSDDKAALKAFRALLSRKDEVSYTDDMATDLDADTMLVRLTLFAKWADRRYDALR